MSVKAGKCCLHSAAGLPPFFTKPYCFFIHHLKFDDGIWHFLFCRFNSIGPLCRNCNALPWMFIPLSTVFTSLIEEEDDTDESSMKASRPSRKWALPVNMRRMKNVYYLWGLLMTINFGNHLHPLHFLTTLYEKVLALYPSICQLLH